MDEIEYKLNTKNSVLVVNAIDKLLTTIKSKYKPAERQKFVVENEELKFLREKCLAKDKLISLTACQGLLALVELGVLDIGNTMSTVITLLPSSHNYSAIISTMAGLLSLDLRSRLNPGQLYKCQFSFKSPQHPFITVLEKNKEAEDEVLTQMHALCTHPDYVVSSNSLELLRAVFLWLTCNPDRSNNMRAWQLLLSLPPSTAHSSLLLSCLSCQQICDPSQLEDAFSSYRAVTESSLNLKRREVVLAVLPLLARIANEFALHGRDPRPCYSLIDRCFSLDAPELRTVAGITLMILANDLSCSSALHLHELFNLCLNIINKYEYSTISLNVFVALTLQWLHLPSYLTSSALKVASKIVDLQQSNDKKDARMYIPNLKANQTFDTLMYADSKLCIIVRLNQTWERIRDNPDKLKSWFDSLESMDLKFKLDLVPFLCGVVLENRKDGDFVNIIVRSIKMLVSLVDEKKGLAIHLLPILLYKISNDVTPIVKTECLRALPLMAKTKENVPTIVAILNKLKTSKGVPQSFLIMLYASLAETQIRCFPYLLEILSDHSAAGRPDELKWETDISRALAVNRICEIRASTNGIELVSVISSLLNRCTDKGGALATSLALSALCHLWKGGAVAPPSTWRALEPKLGRDNRPVVIISLCKLLAEVPGLRVSAPEYDKLVSDAARRLWCYIADSNHPEVVEAACDALSAYKIEDYTLKDIPEIYRKMVKLPPSYCKTPADAARKPEDVLDYVPCEVWPEVFKCTNKSALDGVERLARRLVHREVAAYRSGVYGVDSRVEPQTASYLPPASVVRGLMEFFKKQASSPSYEYPDSVLLAILQTLISDYPKPLPPLDLCFLHEAIHRGAVWKSGCVTLAARQAQTSGSARRLLENYLRDINPAITEESEIVMVFSLLPALGRSTAPNLLRVPLELCTGAAYGRVVHLKAKARGNVNEKHLMEEYLFIKQLTMIGDALKCDKIHDANRTLFSQILENYYAIICHDNVAWSTYVQVLTLLSIKFLERMTSPSSWWETTDELLYKCCSVRSAMAAVQDSERSSESSCPLVWLNEVIDAVAPHMSVHQFSLSCMLPALKAADPDRKSTKEWFLQLMARTQVAFNEYNETPTKLYYVDVFSLSVIALSGHWSFEPDSDELLVSNRDHRFALLPSAVAALLERDLWQDSTIHMLEWLSHSAKQSGAASVAWGRAARALLAARPDQRHWTRLEQFINTNSTVTDD